MTDKWIGVTDALKIIRDATPFSKPMPNRDDLDDFIHHAIDKESLLAALQDNVRVRVEGRNVPRLFLQDAALDGDDIVSPAGGLLEAPKINLADLKAWQSGPSPYDLLPLGRPPEMEKHLRTAQEIDRLTKETGSKTKAVARYAEENGIDDRQVWRSLATAKKHY